MLVRGLLLLTLMLTSQAFAVAKVPFALPQKHPVVGTYSSADHPDAVFVIEAYFNGCGYCNQNAPQVNALATKYASNPKVQVLDVSVDRREGEFQSWIRNNQPNHPVLDDNRRLLLWGDLAARGFPTTYVIDSKGNVKWRHTGVWDGLDEVSQVIDSIIQN